MPNRKATAQANSNIAFIKYWGNRDARLRMPLNDSLSMTLDTLMTETTVAFEEGLSEDQIIVGEAEATGVARTRVVEQLDRIRAQAQVQSKAHVMSRNNFPSGVGLASSASAFAALTLAATRAAGLELNERALSVLARQGSGSAARSIPGGFVEWLAATNMTSTSEQSYARQIAPADFWNLHDVIVVVSNEEKKVGSSDGHLAAHTSPFFSERLNHLPERFHRARRALLTRDLKSLGPLIEIEAIELHFIAMTSRPAIYYWSPDMVRVIDAARAWRDAGLQVYFTLDAGPNVHLICEGKDAETIAANARPLDGVKEVIDSGVGGPARVVGNHLF
jgi:diphosphomevalonate decarboxylase